MAKGKSELGLAEQFQRGRGAGRRPCAQPGCDATPEYTVQALLCTKQEPKKPKGTIASRSISLCEIHAQALTEALFELVEETRKGTK